MATLHDVFPNDHINKIAEELKKNEAIKAPEWSYFVKTGFHKERSPQNKDWWHVRAAAILRKVAISGPIGVSKLRTKFGGKKRRGHKMAIFRKGSGSIIRKALQQLEKAGLLKNKKDGIHKGRIITPQGKSLLDKTATEIAKTMEIPKKNKDTKEDKKPEAKESKKDSEEEPKKEIKQEDKSENKDNEKEKDSQEKKADKKEENKDNKDKEEGKKEKS